MKDASLATDRIADGRLAKLALYYSHAIRRFNEHDADVFAALTELLHLRAEAALRSAPEPSAELDGADFLDAYNATYTIPCLPGDRLRAYLRELVRLKRNAHEPEEKPRTYITVVEPWHDRMKIGDRIVMIEHVYKAFNVPYPPTKTPKQERWKCNFPWCKSQVPHGHAGFPPNGEEKHAK